MRKFLTFIIVLVIQLGIIYGLYKWYVSGNAEPSNVKKTEIVQKTESNKENKIPENKSKKDKQDTIQKSTGKNDSAQLLETKPKKRITEHQKGEMETDNSISDNLSKPLIYKYTDWGIITELPESKLAGTGILVDINNRIVLWAKNCRKSVPIASMTKMMTALIAFETIQENPNISLDTAIKVTDEAYKIGGSQVWLDPRETFTLKELLKTIMIKSANDSAFLIAQYFGNGNVNAFIEKMNKTAKQIGMLNAHFSNPDGLPEKYIADDNRATAEGLVFLAEHLMKYPLAIKWASTKIAWFREGSKNPTMLVNTNALIKNNIPGVNGMKTGYTNRSGFCLTATCTRNGRTLIGVVTGLKTSNIRDRFMVKLLDWGYKKDAQIIKQTGE